MHYPEGDVLPFRMTAEQRRTALEKCPFRSPEYDGVQLFRAKPEPRPPRTPAPPPEKRVLTRTCSCCGTRVKLKRVRAARRPPTPPQKRWWLYYGPGRMTGGFRTKKEARDWYLNGGR